MAGFPRPGAGAGAGEKPRRARVLGGVLAAFGLLTAVVVVAVALLPSRGSASETPRYTVRVLPLGDSITWGQGSPSHSSYRAELWRLVGGQTRYAVRFVGSQRSGNLPQPQNEGHRGYTITRIRTRLDGWMAAARPDIVLLHIGINDLSRHVGPVHASDRLAELIDRIYADRPGVSVVLMGLIPTSRPLQSQAKTYNERAAALQGAERLRGRSFWYVVPPALTRAEMKDRLHPNDAGYARIAHAFFPALSSAAAARATATARAA